MKIYDFNWIFTENCHRRSNQRYSNIDSDNGLVPTRRQAIIRTNNAQFTDAYMRQSAWIS